MIRTVSYAEILNDPSAPSLLAEYAAECSLMELGEPSPKVELYAMLEGFGGFQAFGVYEGEQLVGFATVVVSPLPHYGGRLLGSTESLFISPDHRSGYAWINLKSRILDYARSRGCETFSFIAPKGGGLDRGLSHDGGARHTNNVYTVKL